MPARTPSIRMGSIGAAGSIQPVSTGGTPVSTGGSSEPALQTVVNYARIGVIKTVTKDQIINAFSGLGATDIENGYIYFNTLPANHQTGDKYYIKLEQASSSTSDSQATVGDVVQGYTRRLSASAYSQSGEVSALNETSYTFDSTSVVGRKIKFHVRTDTAVRSWAEGITIINDGVYYSDGNYYIARAGGTAGSKQPVHTQGIISDGSIDFEYFHSGYGIATIISVPDSTHLTAVVEGNLPVLNTSAAYYNFNVYQWSMWGYHNRYPGKVFTFAGRLGYTLDTDGYGSWLQMSKTDAYDDFGTEDFGKQLDTSGINIVISGHPDNRINWVLSGYRLYMGSASGEYNVLGDKATGAISPTSVAILPVSNVGSANVDAIKYQDMNLFVGASTQELYRLKYDYSTDDYVPDDLTTVSEELFSEGITRMQVLRNKERNMYFLTESKRLRFCAVQEEIKTVGAFRVDVDGDVLDFAVSNAGPYSVEYLLVKRGDVATMEVVDSLSPSYMLSRRKIVHSNAEGTVPTTITDLELAGKTIFVQDMETTRFYHVTVGLDGTFENRFTTYGLAYGLPMMSEIHTLPPYNQNNKMEGLQQKSIRFNIRINESGGFSYGSSNDFDKWYEYHNWNTQSGQEWNEEHKLMSGDLQLPAPFGYMQTNNKADGRYPNTTGVALNLRSYSPEPFNLLMVSNLYV